VAESFASSSTQTGRSFRPPTASPVSALRVYVHTLGCKVNQVDSDEIRDALHSYGAEIVADPVPAEVIVVNTCTVTVEADKKSRKLARHFARMPHSPYVVVSGCMAAVDPHSAEGLHERIAVVPDRQAVVEFLINLGLRLDSTPAADASAPVLRDSVGGTDGRVRKQLKVQDGCDCECAYCIVPRARGGSRSSSLESVRAQAEGLVAGGASEIVVTGINLGSYRDGRQNLADVVACVAATGVPRVRLSSIEPAHLTASLLETLARIPSVCRHMHVPLQSGSDRVLAAMNRPYSAEEYLSTMARVREYLPGVALTTDVMVAFPGESDAEAEETRALCIEVGFSGMHVFRYSSRPGTLAASMEGVVASGVARERSAELIETTRILKSRFLGRRLGETAELLIERVVSDGATWWAEGTTREYTRCRVRGDGFAAGDIRVVRLLEDSGQWVLAEVVREG